MTRPGRIGTLVWAVLAAMAALVVARAHYTTDLSAFLPRSPTATQRLLVDQLRDGLASRLIIAAVEGADSASRARVSVAMARHLRSDSQFVSVSNGASEGVDRDREFLFGHRYLLSESVTPERFTVAGLKDAIQDTIDLLASPAGMLVKEMLPHDPTGEIVQIVGQVSGGGAPRTADGVWVSGDGKRALIVAQTRALGSDTDGQQRAVEAVRKVFGEAVTAGAAAAAPDAGAPAAGAAGTPRPPQAQRCLNFPPGVGHERARGVCCGFAGQHHQGSHAAVHPEHGGHRGAAAGGVSLGHGVGVGVGASGLGGHCRHCGRGAGCWGRPRHYLGVWGHA